MIRVEIKDGWTPFVANLHKHLDSELLSGLKIGSQIVQDSIVEAIYKKPWKDSRGGLARSFKPVLSISKKGDKLQGGAFSDSKYAELQNQTRGQTIYPTSGKNLAIPVGIKERNRQHIWPRNWDRGKLFLVVSKRGNALLVESGTWQKTKSGRKNWYQHIRYLLRKSVTICGKDYLGDALRVAKPKIIELLGDKVQVAIGKSEE